MGMSDATDVEECARDAFAPTTDLSHEAVEAITSALRPLLADVFALYVKTKNFHWHMSGRQFRDDHLLLDEQAGQIFAMTDDIAERARLGERWEPRSGQIDDPVGYEPFDMGNSG